MLKRYRYKDCIDNIQYFPVLGIVGPRQVGKTTLSKQLIQSMDKEAVYIDLENPADEAKLTDPQLFFEANQDKCIILDEIQRKPELFPILRSMVDMHRVPGRFLILGSASPHLIRDSSESLAGRIAYEELSPFNLIELSEKQQQTHWMRGGFPDSFLAPKGAIQQKWIRNFIQTYVERDLPMLGLNIDRNIIRKLWTMLAHMQGSVLNMSNLGKSLELSSVTIKKYLTFLEDAFLIRELKPYSQNIKKRLVKSPKVYVRDSGVLHYLLNIETFDQLQGNPILGNSWEGYVIEQICQLLPERMEPYFYRTQDGAECDLVLTKAGVPEIGIEIKYTSSPKISRGNKQSFADLRTKMNYITTPKSDDYLVAENIRVCSLNDFLIKYLNANSN